MIKEIVGVFVFLVIWIIGCALADYVFQFETRAWTMFWGATVSAVGMAFWKGISDD